VRVAIEVIGAGLPRTGTLTQKLALEQLGFAPCYHWVDLLADLDRVEDWERALDGEAVWEQLFDGYRASVDWPGGYFFAELADFYPEAKVVLSVREGEAWERSFRETIWTMCHGDSLMRLLSDARREVDPRWRSYLQFVDRMLWSGAAPFAAGTSTAALIEQMHAFNDRVRSTIAPERLLVWSVGEGWEPLCEFLGVAVPDGALPHENDRDTFVSRVSDGAIAALNEWQRRRAGEHVGAA
jgi:hypothetical protein